MFRAARPITTLIACLLVLTPFVWASTAETWTDGIYDYESDEVLQIVGQTDVAAIPSDAAADFSTALVVVGCVALADQPLAIAVALPTSQTRGPPLF